MLPSVVLLLVPVLLVCVQKSYWQDEDSAPRSEFDIISKNEHSSREGKWRRRNGEPENQQPTNRMAIILKIWSRCRNGLRGHDNSICISFLINIQIIFHKQVKQSNWHVVQGFSCLPQFMRGHLFIGIEMIMVSLCIKEQLGRSDVWHKWISYEVYASEIISFSRQDKFLVVFEWNLCHLNRFVFPFIQLLTLQIVLTNDPHSSAPCLNCFIHPFCGWVCVGNAIRRE